MKISILADSTCDLSEELHKTYNVRRLPLGVVLGDAIYKDGTEITPKDIFAYVSSGKGISKTNAINVAEYAEAFSEEFAKGAEAILHFSISSKLSSCYDNAVLAAQEFENVYPIDTQSLSTGSAWLVLYAAELAQDGMTAAEIAAECERKKLLSDTSFVIDTLEYLHKGGRCSGLAALASGLFNIKPCLNVIDGKIEVGKKYRGSIEKSVHSYIKERLKDRSDLDMRRAFVTHTMDDHPDFVAEIVELVKSLQPFDEVLTTSAGCTVSNHCGPMTLGVLIYRTN